MSEFNWVELVAGCRLKLKLHPVMPDRLTLDPNLHLFFLGRVCRQLPTVPFSSLVIFHSSQARQGLSHGKKKKTIPIFVGLSSVLKEEKGVLHISNYEGGPDKGWCSSKWEETVHHWRAQG